VHDRISSLATRIERQLSKLVVSNLEILEADAAKVREAAQKVTTKANHHAAWEMLDALIPTKEARLVTSLRLETKSGNRATAEGGEIRLYNSETTLDESKRSSTAMEERRAGTTLEMEPTIGADGETIELNVSLEHHHGPPMDRWDTINVSGEKTLESPVVDFYVAEVTTGYTTLSGMTKLLGIWKPEGANAVQNGDKLQAAFLTSHVATLLPALDARVEQLLRAHGEKVEKTPAAAPKTEAGAPKGIITRTFRITPDVLTMDDPMPAMGGAGAAPAADPFAAAPGESRLSVRITAMEILKSKGIPFPEGSSATYTENTGELVVRNTHANMQVVEEFIVFRKKHAARTLVTSFHIIEGDVATIRKLSQDTAAITDHSAAWKTVSTVPSPRTA
jgi:type II secretory pathway component GspD/PulD (secretin)